MIIFKDENDNIITRVDKGTAIMFHNRLLINPDMFLKEGDSVMLFTDENLEEFQKYYNKKLKETLQDHLTTQKTFNKYIEKTKIIIENLQAENENLKTLNKQLSENIVKLKEL